MSLSAQQPLHVLGSSVPVGRAGVMLAILSALLSLAAGAAGAGAGDMLTVACVGAALAAGGGAVWMFVLGRRQDQAEELRARLILQVFDGMRSAHFVTDAQGRLAYANQASFALLGDGLRTGDPAAPERLFGGDSAAVERVRRLGRDAAAGQAGSAELPRILDDGANEWWLIAARAVEGWPGHVHWRLEDATDQRATETSLRDQQARLLDFMDHAPVGFYSVDRTGRFLFVNATLASWLGVDPAELLRGGHRLHDFLISPPAGMPPYALTPDGSEPATVELVLRGRQGRVFAAAIAQTVVHGGESGSVWTRSLVRDLTPEHEMREALHASEARFRRFFEDAPIGIALLDHDGCLAESNRAFATLLGAAPGQLAGRPVIEVMAERDRGPTATRLAAVLDGAETEMPIEVRLVGRNPLVVSLFAKRLESGPGDRPGLILQCIDQTERKSLESQFAQSQKMQAVGQLAGGIAHDFNNLLTAMIGFCDLLLLRHKPGDASFGDIMQIKQNANRAANLVRQLLAFSRQQTLQPRVLNITDALAELSNLLRRLIGENIELKMVHGRDLGLVKVDQGQLEQVIINLAVNARDAMIGGGRLTIATSNLTTAVPTRYGTEEMPPGDYVAIEVVDTGTGIPPEIIDRIFDPFFSTKEVGSGTGLGLSTVYGIVRQTGGFVMVDSSPGRGAKFTIFLPRYRAAAAADARTAEEARDGTARDLTGAGRILLVEDEDPVRVFSARALRNKGYEVAEARSGDEALAVLAKDANAIDLLITDVVMPKMDGPALIRRVREIRPDIQVICISGYTEDRFRQHVGASETVHFLAKPFSLKQLAGKVKDVIRKGQ